jgi:hypothetical protein
VLGFATALAAQTSSAQNLLCSGLFTDKIRQSQKTSQRDVIADNVDDFSMTPHKDMQRLVQTLLQTIEYNYGPLKIKKTTVGLNWEQAKQKLLRETSQVRTEKELLFKIANFLYSFNDAHISIQLPSSLKWTLPLQVSYAEGSNSYVLNYIDLQAISSNIVAGELPPLGAELVSINGKTPDDFRRGIPALNATGNELTNRSIFGSKVFKLSEQTGIPLSTIENNGWDFTFRWTDASGQIQQKTTKLKYTVTGGGMVDLNTTLPPTSASIYDKLAGLVKEMKEKATVSPTPGKTPVQAIHSPQESLLKDLRDLFQAEVRMDELTNPTSLVAPSKALGTRYDIAQTKPLFKLPDDFKSIDLPEEFTAVFDPTQIFAGTFIKNGKKVALLRIPTYSIANVSMAPLVIDYLVRTLEMSSDYMILDQMNNPGGAVVYSDFWIKALVGKYDTSKHLHFRVKPTSGFLNQFKDILVKFDVDSLMLPESVRRPILNSLREQFEIVHRAYIAREPLSQPITLLPVSEYIQISTMMDLAKKLAPPRGQRQGDLFGDQSEHSLGKPAVYTKPIYMVINQFDFSGGDATPASLQDYGRVKLVGTRTAGAGGTVEEFSSRELSLQFPFHLTTSLMYRPGNSKSPYVENYGVTPDILLPATADDYVSGFSTYLDRLVLSIEQDMRK